VNNARSLGLNVLVMMFKTLSSKAFQRAFPGLIAEGDGEETRSNADQHAEAACLQLSLPASMLLECYDDSYGGVEYSPFYSSIVRTRTAIRGQCPRFKT